MVYSARTLALLLATSVASVTSLILSLFDSVGTDTLWIIAIISFSTTFVVIDVLLEFLIFGEINKIYKMMDKFRKKPLTNFSKQKSEPLNPLQKINDEIFSFATFKQKEIDELKKVEVFRKDFIANVSHELKTPIFAAQGFVHTLLDGADKDGNVRKRFLKKAAKSLDRLDILVQDLLTLSQIETGGIKMRFERVDLYELCAEVVDQFEAKAEKRNINLKLQGDQRKIIVYADWQRITQVVTNLVSNAVNYTPEGGDITISFASNEKYVTTFISDTGEGIPEEHLARIFERFYRVDMSRSREKGGTGLGLAIAKHILEGHNSQPEVESTVGKGSVFSFTLSRSLAIA